MDKQSTKTAVEEVTKKIGKGKKIAIVVFLVLILLNVFWTLMNNKVTEEIQAIKSEIAQVSARVSDAEKETLDVESVKADVELIRKATGDFEKKLNAVIQAEETRLEILTKDAEAQKAYVETLKGLLEGSR
jgi:cell division protein FtsL